MVKLGIVVFANDSGLGAQTRRLTYMLRPHKILAIDSKTFSKNKKQHFDWYDGFSGYKVVGFPNNREVNIFLNEVTHVLLCENPLNFNLLRFAKQRDIKVYIQSNYEFCDHLDKNLELPTKFLMPSYWKIQEMNNLFGEDRVMYLPPPIDPQEFVEAREVNMSRGEIENRRTRFLHIVGTLAVNDRNGTLDLIKAVERVAKEDFELVIRSQHDLPQKYISNDKRITYVIDNEPEAQKMYEDFDALILPRRYGGLSLTTNEALMSGLPVIMTDISPNNLLLPNKWLVRSSKSGEFKTRTIIDIYSASPVSLGQKIDWLCQQDKEAMKIKAFEIGHKNFSVSALQSKYEDLFYE